MLVREAGSGSVLFLGVVVPLAALFLLVGIELQHFFGAREEIQRIVDERARLDVTRALDGHDSAALLKRQVASLGPHLEAINAQHHRQKGSVAISLSGVYTGVFAQAFTALSGGRGSPGIPFSIYSRARRPRTSALVAIERTIGDGEPECGNVALRRRELLARRLVMALRENEVDVRYGTFPAGEDGFTSLSAEAQDPLLHCPGIGGPSIEQGSSLRGVSYSEVWGIESTFGIVRAAFNDLQRAEIAAILLVSRNSPDGMKGISEVAELTAAEAALSPHKTKVFGLVEGVSAEGAREIWRGDVAGVDLRIVPVVSESPEEAAVISAAVHDLSSHIVVAR